MRGPSLRLFLWISLLCWELELSSSSSFSTEGRDLLRPRERVEIDPYSALSNWIKGVSLDTCSWFGVECSDDGKVFSLNVRNASIRKLLQQGSNDKGRHSITRKKQRTNPVPPPTLAPSSLISPVLSPFYAPEGSLSPEESAPPISLSQSPSTHFPAPIQSSSPITKLPSPLLDNHTHSDTAASGLFPAPSESSLPLVATSVKNKNHLWKIYGPIGLGVSFLFSLTTIYILCFRANKAVTVRPWATGLSGQLQRAFVTGVPALKRSEVEIACEDFSNIIGSLWDCKLYKGTLSSGVEIAVASSLITSAKNWSKQSESQFRKKISSLSKVNHKNFMNLLGYCEEGGPFTRIMVFEYAPCGTLFEHLHIKEAEPLDWAARLRVAMGIAYCLEYMHQLNPPVILRNLDSSSVYLTDDYAAKISDIGFCNEVKESEVDSGSSGPLDTPTLEPEDIVYKFGIILLELLSGRLPFSEDDGLMENWASCYLTGKRPLRDMIDPTLKSMNDMEISSICEVIKSCIKLDPKERPTMIEVARRLRDITAMSPEGATPRLSPLWWAELEVLSSEV